MPKMTRLWTSGTAERRLPMTNKQNFCQRCHQVPLTEKNQKYCADCREEQDRQSRRKWYANHKGQRRAYHLMAQKMPKLPGITFSFTSGKWYWQKENLGNGPFDSLKAARLDAKRAFV